MLEFFTLRRVCHPLPYLAFLAAVLLMRVQPLVAQRPSARKTKVAAPIDEALRTKDGLKLSLRYYPGPKSRSTTPVILIHGWEGQGSEFYKLAELLQHPAGGGHSVLVPDLRGHGESTSMRRPGASRSVTIRAEKFRRPELEQMINYDLETAKSYLMQRHQNEELNVDALTVIGADVGALLAAYWTARDWSWPQLPGVKQGQDVKALVMLSPVQGFKGLTMQLPFEQPALREAVSLLVVYGENDSKAASSVRRIRNALKRHRRFEFDNEEEEREDRDVFFKGLPTSLQGTDLLTDQQLPTAKGIAVFIERRVTDRMDDRFPWSQRANPLN